MFDYIKVSLTFEDKVTAFLGHTQFVGQIFNKRKYLVQGCEHLELLVCEDTCSLVVQGSLPYWWQGHNFTFSNQQFRDAINHLNTLLQVDLWQGRVEVFEYGVIMRVDEEPKAFIKSHKPATHSHLLEDCKAKDKGKFKWYTDTESKALKLKMYDAGANIKHKQGHTRQEIIEGVGWNKESYYLKWECHYLKPECLNNWRGLKLYQLLNPRLQNAFKEDLYLQYQRLLPMKSLSFTSDPKKLQAIDLAIVELAELLLNDGHTISEVKERLYARINAMPNWSKADKDNRKRAIKKALDKLEQDNQSKWDISERIATALAEEENTPPKQYNI